MSQLQSDPDGDAAISSEDATGSDRVLGVPVHNGLAIATVLLGIVLWEVAARVAFDRLEIVFPPLASIVGELYWLFASGEIYPHLAITAQQVLFAFLFGLVYTVGLSALGGYLGAYLKASGTFE